jgi:hypothetical protein
MKTKFVMVSMLVATNAMAFDFETEYAKFASDFSRLRSMKVSMVATPKVVEVAPTAPVITPIPSLEEKPVVLLDKNTESNVLQQVDPKSSNRLGFKLSDPNMRDRVIEAYNKPNALVYSLTLE